MRLFSVKILFILWFPVYAENFSTRSELLEHCDGCIYSANVSNVSACAYCVSNVSLIHNAFVEWGLMEPKWCINSTRQCLGYTTISSQR